MKSINVAIERARRRKRLGPPEVRRLLREQAGLTQIELAEAIGVTRATVGRWESGARNPSRRVVDRYLEVLERLRDAS